MKAKSAKNRSNAPPAAVPVMITERKITVNNTIIHLRSIFTEQTSLDEAMKNIIMRRLSEEKFKACS
jgi:hypothetical protein